jgi:hypothetical protein
MPLRLPRLLAAVATISSLLAAASVSMASPVTDETARAAAVLDRVFDYWKARSDRVHSLHFTWDCRTTYRKGWFDPSRAPGTRLDRDQVFEQFGVQVWIDGNERLCLVETPSFKVPEAKVTDTRRMVRRLVIDGTTASRFSVGSEYETGAPPTRPLGPHGLVFPSHGLAGLLPDPQLQALSLTFRPQHPTVAPWLKEQCKLVDENARVDDVHCVKIERVVDETRPPRRREEACWVNPACDDVVVRWTVKSRVATYLGSIKYKKDNAYGWIPSEWTFDTKGRQLSEFKVTGYAINEEIDPRTFSQNFPAGTPVEDNGIGRHYIVEQDGSRRTISHHDFLRRAGIYVPEKQFPAKPQPN